MNRIFQQYDTVRVVRLHKIGRRHDGTGEFKRSPRVGDTGVICHIYEPSRSDSVVAVEMINDDGMTVWLADFKRSELELVRNLDDFQNTPS